MFRWVNPKRLDKLVFDLRENGIWADRHAYSYRLMYKDRLVASLHIYPGYNEFSLRLYKSFKTLAREAEEIIVKVLKQNFPEYKVRIAWYPQ